MLFFAVVTGALRNVGRVGAGSRTDGQVTRRPLSSSKSAERAACRGTYVVAQVS